MSSLFIIIPMLFFTFCCASMAKKKNKNVLLWTLLGAIGGIITLLILAMSSYNCIHCGSNFAAGSDGTHCGSCGKSDLLTEDELKELSVITDKLKEDGMRIRADGVKIKLTQSSGAIINFVGIEQLKEYIQR